MNHLQKMQDKRQKKEDEPPPLPPPTNPSGAGSSNDPVPTLPIHDPDAAPRLDVAILMLAQ